MSKIFLKKYPVTDWITLTIFAVFSLIYFFHFTDYLFFYQEQGVLFQTDWNYFAGFLKQPGGVLQYLANFQTTLYFYSLLGTAIVSATLLCIVVALNKIAVQLATRSAFLLSLTIGALMLLLQINYIYPAINNLGILLQLLLFYCTLRLKGKWSPIMLAVVVPFNYYLCGSFAFLYVILLISRLIETKRWLDLVTTLSSGLIFAVLAGRLLFYETIKNLLVFPFSIEKVVSQIPLFIITVVLVLLFPLLVKLNTKKFAERKLFKVSVKHFVPVIILTCLFATSSKLITPKYQHYFRAQKLFTERKFNEMLALNAKQPTRNMLTQFLNNVALAETGQLSSHLFSLRQNSQGRTLFLQWDKVTEILKRGGYFYYAIGMANEAHRWAYEYMVMEGFSPNVVRMLIKTDLIAGEYKTAAKYIDMLDKTLFYKREADYYKGFLFNDDAVIADNELGAKRRLNTAKDYFVVADNPPQNIEAVLAADSTNIPALEYKLAWLMLQKNMQGVVNLLPLMEKEGYKRIPKNVEEAVTAYKLMKVGEMPALETLKVNANAERRFKQFYQAFQQYRGNKKAAKRALAREFGDTYWYYVFFGARP